MKPSIRVLIVDDSALIRQILTTILNADPFIEVVGQAHDPYDAREKIKAWNPDVITLDVEMPRMDGVSFLHKIMSLRPMPVVMVSSLTQQGADVTLQALELGAVDFVAKPAMDLEVGMHNLAKEIIKKVKIASRTQIRALSEHYSKRSDKKKPVRFTSTEKIVAIGASTGGVMALREVLMEMPATCPAILITQHMPIGYSGRFAERLNNITNLTVQEARDGQRILPGHAYVAPGDAHMSLNRSGANYTVCVSDAIGPVGGHMPSVDILFESVAKSAGKNAIGVIMTGMGRDGAKGLLQIRESGGGTAGQNEATCTVYGMPRAALELGGVEFEVPLQKIATLIADFCGERTLRI